MTGDIVFVREVPCAFRVLRAEKNWPRTAVVVVSVRFRFTSLLASRVFLYVVINRGLESAGLTSRCRYLFSSFIFLQYYRRSSTWQEDAL